MWWLSFCGGWLAVGGSLELEQSCVAGWLAVGLKPLSCSCAWWLGAGAGNDRLTKWRCWLLGGWSRRAELIHAITLRGFHLGFVRLRLERVWVCDVFVLVYVMCVCECECVMCACVFFFFLISRSGWLGLKPWREFDRILIFWPKPDPRLKILGQSAKKFKSDQ